MRDAVALLKKHGVPMQQDYFVALENVRGDLKEVADKALGPVKEAILPLQSKEANNVKDRRRKFQIKVLEYRREFQDNVPFGVPETDEDVIRESYATISEYFLKTLAMEDEAKELQTLESLFDLQRTNYKELKDCKFELIQVKKLWDLVSLIDLQFGNWKKTLW
jgi:dynein heavy chain